MPYCTSPSSIHSLIHCDLTSTLIVSLTLSLPMSPPNLLFQPSLPGPIYLLPDSSFLPSLTDSSFPDCILSVNDASDICPWPFIIPILKRGPQSSLGIVTAREFLKIHMARSLEVLLWGHLCFVLFCFKFLM